MTLKVHVFYNHLKDYFDWTATSLKFLNGEAVETAHSTIRIAGETWADSPKKYWK